MKFVRRVSHSYHPLELMLLGVCIVAILFLLWSIQVIRQNNKSTNIAVNQAKSGANLGTVDAVDEATDADVRAENSINATQDKEDAQLVGDEEDIMLEMETLYDETAY